MRKTYTRSAQRRFNLVTLVCLPHLFGVFPPNAVAADQPKQEAASEQSSGGAVIEGRCVDENGQPLPDVGVSLYLVDLREDRQVRVQAVTTDPTGGFRFTDVPKQARRDDGYQHRYLLVADTVGRATTTRAFHEPKEAYELTMPAAASVKGTVTDPDGRPIEGALARFDEWLPVPLDGLRNARTDEHGRFEIDDLAAYNVEDYTRDLGGGIRQRPAPCFLVEHPDYAPTRVPYDAIPTEVEVVMEPAAAISGRVAFATTGDPAVGVPVKCQGTDAQEHRHWATATTDDEGRYELTSLPAGPYNIWAETPEWTIKALDSFVVQSGVRKVAPDLQFIQGGFIAGRLLNAITGERVTQDADAKTRIGLHGPSRPRSGAAIESEPVRQDGSFLIRVAPGENYVYFYNAGPWQLIEAKSHTVDVTDGETVEVQFFVMPRRPAKEEAEDVRQLRAWERQWQREKPAIAAITELGGWVETEPRGPYKTVVEVNMSYHYTEKNERLDNNQFTDEALFYVPKFRNLRRLLLTETQATDEALAHIRGMEHLERIYMWDARLVTDHGVRHLATLPKLKYVYLSNSRIGDDALVHLRDAPHLWTQLEGLSLQGNTFSDRALEHLSVFVNLKRLHLGLGNNGITDKGLESITALQSLEVLDLQRSLVTDKGLSHLAKLPFLKVVWLSGTKVTDAGIARLRESHPDVLVRR